MNVGEGIGKVVNGTKLFGKKTAAIGKGAASGLDKLASETATDLADTIGGEFITSNMGQRIAKGVGTGAETAIVGAAGGAVVGGISGGVDDDRTVIGGAIGGAAAGAIGGFGAGMASGALHNNAGLFSNIGKDLEYAKRLAKMGAGTADGLGDAISNANKQAAKNISNIGSSMQENWSGFMG